MYKLDIRQMQIYAPNFGDNLKMIKELAYEGITHGLELKEATVKLLTEIDVHAFREYPFGLIVR